MQTHFRISNIACEACVKLSTKVLQEIPGVSSVSIDIQNGNTQIETTEKISFEHIQKALEEIGKEVEQIAV